MENNTSSLRKLLIQAIRFVGLSGIGWLLDFTVYTVLSFLMDDLALVNMLSSLVGASFVFVFSTRFVFQNSRRVPLAVKYIIYVLYQLILIYLISQLLAYVNSLILGIFTAKLIVGLAPTLSKIIVTPITMVINFFIMKLLTEKL